MVRCQCVSSCCDWAWRRATSAWTIMYTCMRVVAGRGCAKQQQQRPLQQMQDPCTAMRYGTAEAPCGMKR